MKCIYKPYGNNAILIVWESKIDKKILNDILQFQQKIEKNNIKEIVEVTQSINSLLIIYNENNISFFELKHLLETLKRTENVNNERYIKKRWLIPVCYDKSFGIDLAYISKKTDLKISKIIHIHTNSVYDVFAIGFLPGFLYLGGLDKRLHIERKETPRLAVKKGAVGIGGLQTGIYPKTSPGGWQILGNSPISFFDAKLKKPCFASAGDQLQFYAITLEEYNKISTEISNQKYTVKHTLL